MFEERVQLEIFPVKFSRRGLIGPDTSTTAKSMITDETLKELVDRLKRAFLMMSGHKQSNKLALIKLLLSYQIWKMGIVIHSESELQVLVYNLSKALNKEALGQTPLMIKMDEAFCYQRDKKLNLVVFPKKQKRQAKNRLRSSRCYIVRKLLEIDGQPLSSSLAHPEMELEYVRQLDAYMARFDQAVERAFKTVNNKLHVFVDKRFKPNHSWSLLEKIAAQCGWVRSVRLDVKQDYISQYHNSGVFAEDCRKVYIRDMIGVVSGKNINNQ